MSRPVSARRAAASQAARASPEATASKASKSRSTSATPSTARTSSVAMSRARVGDELLERAERVAERAGRVAGEQRDGVGRDLDRLRGGDARDDGGDLLDRRAGEVEAVAAVDDRRQDLLRLGRGEDEDRVRRRLLERLEERVPRLRGQHVRLVEDVDLRAPGHRRELHGLAQLADVVDRVVRRRVHLDDVQRRRAGDRDARLALARRAPPSARARSSCTPRASSPSTSCPSPASPRTGRHGGPCPARRHCAGSSRHAPGPRRPRTFAGGGGGTTRGRRSRRPSLVAGRAVPRSPLCAVAACAARAPRGEQLRRVGAFAGSAVAGCLPCSRGWALENGIVAAKRAHPSGRAVAGWPAAVGRGHRARSCVGARGLARARGSLADARRAAAPRLSRRLRGRARALRAEGHRLAAVLACGPGAVL